MGEPAALGAIALAFLVVAASPGPANLACASVAMARGRRDGLRMAAGLAIGLALWGGLAALGLGAVLQASEQALIVLKCTGGAYLLWLAIGAGRSVWRPHRTDHAVRPAAALVWQGLVLNLSNPKAVFAWMAALAVGLDPAAGGAGLWLAVTLCVAIGAANYALWACLFSLGGMMATYRRFGRWLDGLCAALFGLAGLVLIRSALAR